MEAVRSVWAIPAMAFGKPASTDSRLAGVSG